MTDRVLTIHLDPAMTDHALSGQFNFINRVRAAVESRGWRTALAPETDAPPERFHYALHHMSGPQHPRVKIFRRTYYYPFWHIETDPRRWHWPVAHKTFNPYRIGTDKARRFIHQLRQRIMPGLSPRAPEHVLIPLQARLTETRSFQTMSPAEMVEAVAATGKTCIATLHPGGRYTRAELGVLDDLVARYPNLSVGGDSRALLPGAEYVATQNSSVAVDAYLMTRPVVLFGQADFHHIALNVADLGAEQALAQAPHHRAFYAKYLWWFLCRLAIDATSPDAAQQIVTAMKKGGWPL